MRPMRPSVSRSMLLVSLLAVAGGPVTGAHAGKPVQVSCRLVTDRAGDSNDFEGQRTTPDPAADVVSADVASNQHWVTAVIRVDGWAHAAPYNAASFILTVKLDFEGHALEFRAIRFGDDLDATVVAAPRSNDTAQSVTELSGVRGVLDPDRREIRVSVPTAAVDDVLGIERTTKFHHVDVRSQSGAGAYRPLGQQDSPFAGRVWVSDSAVSYASYRHAARSCVRPGA